MFIEECAKALTKVHVCNCWQSLLTVSVVLIDLECFLKHPTISSSTRMGVLPTIESNNKHLDWKQLGMVHHWAMLQVTLKR